MAVTFSSVDNFKRFALLALLMVSNCASREVSRRDERRLLKDLLTGYDVDERPVNNAADIMNVTVSIAYRDLLEMDERAQTLKSNVWLRITWRDIFLQWDPAEYGNYGLIRVHPSRIWTPDMTLFNNVKKENRGGALYGFESQVLITYDGNVTLLATVVTLSSCRLKISKFPFDTQTCILKIGSWMYDGLAINLLTLEENNPDLSSLTNNTEWEIVSATSIRNRAKYNCCPAPFYDIDFVFRIRRKPLYYIMTTIVPCVVLSLLASISFFFPADSGERISLVMSVLLGLIVFMLIVNDNTPVNSDSVPIITQYFNCIGLLIFVSLIATGMVIRLNNKHGQRPVGRRLARFRDTLAYFLDAREDFKDAREQVEKPVLEMAMASVNELCFLAELPETNKDGGKGIQEDILLDLRRLMRRIEDDDRKKAILDEWKFTARVLDKFFLLVFLVTFIVMTLAFYVTVHNSYNNE